MSPRRLATGAAARGAGDASALEHVGATIARVAAAAGPSVVGLGRGWGLGSGAVIAPGRVLTAAHALRGDEATVILPGGRREQASLLAADPDLDLAVLEAGTGEAPVLDWGPDEPPALGTPVIALGDPGGRGLRATPGFVSAAGRPFRGPRGRRAGTAVEHTAPLPRGSSGGPLVDLAGRLLGVNALRREGGLIVAVSTHGAARGRVEALVRGEAPARVRLGVAVVPPRVARRMRRAVGMEDRAGVLVRAVERGGPADRAGVRRGDLLVRVGDHEVERLEALYAALDAVSPGGRLELGVLRGVEELDLTVESDGEGAP